MSGLANWDWRIHRRPLSEFTPGPIVPTRKGGWHRSSPGGVMQVIDHNEYAEQWTSNEQVKNVPCLIWKYDDQWHSKDMLTYYEGGYFDGLERYEFDWTKEPCVGYPGVGTPQHKEYLLGYYDAIGKVDEEAERDVQWAIRYNRFVDSLSRVR